MKTFILSFILFLNSFEFIFSQDLYDRATVQVIEIFFNSATWDADLDAANLLDTYIVADSVRINGIVYDSVGVKYKGNSSYNANNNKNPLHINLDYLISSQDYQGFTELKLQNCYGDPSMIREVLAYSILEQYMSCPQSNFANVFINGTLRGVYSNTQSIDNKFNGDHYYSTDGSFFKCNATGGGGPGSVHPDLTFTTTDSSSYLTGYELKSTYGWNNLVDLIDTLNNNFAAIETMMDVDRAMWMLAFNNVLVNLDSYTGSSTQNYYLYRDLNERFVSTIWDLNMSFAGFPGALGTGPIIASNLDPMAQNASTNHPLIVKLLGNPMYKRMYMAHLRTIVQEIFGSGNYLTTANTLRTTIDPYVLADPYKFYTYTQFQNSLTTSVTGGPITVLGIQALMTARVSYLSSNADYILSAPSIVTFSASNPSPQYGETITISASCSNETAVYLGYRYEQPLKFNRIPMYDDGAHNDGAAGDHVYGVSVTMNCNLLEYYIYADNNSAGIFSPQRAEHEFHTLQITSTTPIVGDLVINEFMADNNNTVNDYNGESNDWIEIYNTTSNALNLSGMYLSDDGLIPSKWQFPAGSIISPYEFLIVWADNDTLQFGYHSNFKLGINGESILLSNNLITFDQIDYPIQTTDVSYSRCPDAGVFTFGNPTFAETNNCYLTIKEEQLPLKISVYPVPTQSTVFVESKELGTLSLTIVDLQGRIIYSLTSDDKLIEIPSTNWNSGFYRILIVNENGQTSNLPFIKE